jgi:Protein O-mannosyl-transferase TMEM260-like
MLAFALAFLCGHLPFLSPGLEDIDSLNFALGVRDFDPTRHQPHPPGYPLFISLGKLTRWMGLSEAHALAVWGALFGALSILALMPLFRAIDGVDRRAVDEAAPWRAALATVLTVICPLFWFTAARPMSDIPGLAVALLAQTLLATAFWRQRGMQPGDREAMVESGRLIVLGSFVAALALGFRSQTIWLTGPPLLLVILHRIGRGGAGAMLGASMTFALGVTLWAVPMVIASGGPGAYIGALGSQAGEDLSGVDMLIRNPTVRTLAAALGNTFVLPWGTVALGSVVFVLSVLGAGVMLARAQIGLLLLIVLVGPYAVLHLLVQETLTTRYALPLIPAVCYLAIRGVSLMGRRAAFFGAAILILWAASQSVPAVSMYAASSSPVVQAFEDLTVAARSAPEAPLLGMHYAFLRAAEVTPPTGVRVIASVPKHEWLATARHLHDTSTVWFLADPLRTDLALFDPVTRRIRGRYRWPAPLNTLLSGVRPSPVDWVEITDPGWFLEEGWSLTPETAGVVQLEGVRSRKGSAAGFVRRRAESSILLIGGRNLDLGPHVALMMTINIDDRAVGSVNVPPYPGFFLTLLTLPAGTLAGPGRYAPLRVDAARSGLPNAGIAERPDVAIEQFNLQSTDRVLWGFDTGWYEQEFNPATGRLWRWTSERAETIVHHAAKDLVLTVAGESPLRYFDRTARLTVRAGNRVLAQQDLSTDFELTVHVPAAALDAARHRLTLETDETFVPADRSTSLDRRRLGLRIWKFEIAEK